MGRELEMRNGEVVGRGLDPGPHRNADSDTDSPEAPDEDDDVEEG